MLRTPPPRCLPPLAPANRTLAWPPGNCRFGGNGEEVGEPLGRRPPGPLPLHRCAGTWIKRHVADGGIHPHSAVHLGPSCIAVIAVVAIVALGEEEAIIVVVVVPCAAGRQR